MQESIESWPLGHRKKILFFVGPKCEYQNITTKVGKEHKSLTLGPTSFLWGPPFHMFDIRCRDHQSSTLCPTKKISIFGCRTRVWLLLIRCPKTISNFKLWALPNIISKKSRVKMWIHWTRFPKDYTLSSTPVPKFKKQTFHQICKNSGPHQKLYFFGGGQYNTFDKICNDNI